MAETKKRTRKPDTKEEQSRIFAFDMDGTLCEMFYGENCMNLYKDEDDKAIRRTFINDSYENTRPIPQAQKLVSEIMDKVSSDSVYVITSIHNGMEFMHKTKWLENHFPGLNPSNVIGVIEEDDKARILHHIMSSHMGSNLLYVDDNLSYLIKIFALYHSTYNVSVAHSSVILTRTTEEFMKIYGI